jgi:hypothetical protein
MKELYKPLLIKTIIDLITSIIKDQKFYSKIEMMTLGLFITKNELSGAKDLDLSKLDNPINLIDYSKKLANSHANLLSNTILFKIENAINMYEKQKIDDVNLKIEQLNIKESQVHPEELMVPTRPFSNTDNDEEIKKFYQIKQNLPIISIGTPPKNIDEEFSFYNQEIYKIFEKLEFFDIINKNSTEKTCIRYFKKMGCFDLNKLVYSNWRFRCFCDFQINSSEIIKTESMISCVFTIVLKLIN